MTRLLAVCTALAAVLALPATAVAKEVKKATVCGPDGCTTTQTQSDRDAVAFAVENGGPPSSPPREHAPFYRVNIFVKGDTPPGGEPSLRLLVSPGARRSRSPDGTWFAMSGDSYRAWRRVTRDVKPFPAGRLPGVDPNAPRPVQGGPLPPQTYAPALERPPAATGGGTDWGLIGGIAAGSLALLAAATLLVARRRRRGGGPQTAPVS